MIPLLLAILAFGVGTVLAAIAYALLALVVVYALVFLAIGAVMVGAVMLLGVPLASPATAAATAVALVAAGLVSTQVKRRQRRRDAREQRRRQRAIAEARGQENYAAPWAARTLSLYGPFPETAADRARVALAEQARAAAASANYRYYGLPPAVFGPPTPLAHIQRWAA